MQLFRFLFCFWLAVVLTACSTQYSLLSRVVLELNSQSGVAGGDSHLPAKPDLRYRYLRVDVSGKKPAMLVLAFEEPHPLGSVEVWYSNAGQVIKTLHGRIISTHGLETNWLNVQLPFLPVQWLPLKLGQVEYQRVRDQMPGYQYQVSDTVFIKPLQNIPSIDLPGHNLQKHASHFRWFEETSNANLPNSYYAWGVHRGQYTVVYSEQCLSVGFCLKLQRWPVQEEPF